MSITEIHMTPCPCDGPIALPLDVREMGPYIFRTSRPDLVRQIHAEGCEASA